MPIGAEVFGLAECLGAFSLAETLLRGEMMEGVLRETAEAVAASSRDKISKYEGSSLGTIKPGKITAQRAAVYQNKRKVTGQHGQFGTLQMQKGLLPALDENTDKLASNASKGIDKLKAATGL